MLHFRIKNVVLLFLHTQIILTIIISHFSRSFSEAKCKSALNLGAKNYSNQNISNGWRILDSKNCPIGPVHDDRWQDFVTTDNSRYQRFEGVSSVSFSINCKIPLVLEYFADDGDRLDFLSLNCSNTKETWENFSLIVQDHTYFFQNDHLVKTTSNLIPEQVVFKTSKDTEWKIQNYTLGWSRSATEQFYISIPVEIPTLTVFTLLCGTCGLTIASGSADEVNVTSSKNETYLWEQSWQRTDIKLSKSVYLNFTPYLQNPHVTDQYWAIDVRTCSGDEKKTNWPKHTATFRRRNIIVTTQLQFGKNCICIGTYNHQSLVSFRRTELAKPRAKSGPMGK
ncbi:uncharacterized protein LOC135138133 [Zophobas morio]|uniref:uncharacterized protein LOC135138133 n=1 Tax=Zophobas morio TaxID=2755281 RepID=UPI003083841C